MLAPELDKRVEKVAMLVKMLTPALMMNVLKTLPREIVEKIDKHVKEDKTVIKEDGLKVLAEFNQTSGLIVATDLYSSVIDEYDEALMADSPAHLNKKKLVGFRKLTEQSVATIFRIISEEEPLYQVVILKQLDQKTAQEVFSLMTTVQRIKFTLEAKYSGEIKTKVLIQISKTIEGRIEGIIAEKKSNFDAVLNLVAGIDDESLEEMLKELPPEIADEIKEATITFSDILNQAIPVIQVIFAQFNGGVIAKAISTSSEDKRNSILENLTGSKREETEYNLQDVDITKMKPILDAQREIVLEAKMMRDKGTIELIK